MAGRRGGAYPPSNEFGAGQRDVVDPARWDFDLAVTFVSQQKGKSVPLQRSAVEGMTRIGNRDLTLGNLRVGGGITLVVFCVWVVGHQH